MARGRLLLIAIAMTGVIGLLGMQLAAADTTPFGTPGTGQDFAVPANVCSVTISATGASGGDGADPIFTGPGTGGGGDHVTGTIPVTPGEHLNVNVGGRGGDGELTLFANGGEGGINGGGDGGDALIASAGGGGGASDVRQGSGGSGCVPECVAPVLPTGSNTSTDSRVVTAGGGGGGGGGIFIAGGDGGSGGAASVGTPSGDGDDDPFFGTPPGGEGGQAGANGGAGGDGSVLGADGDNGTTTGQGGEGGSDLLRAGGGGGGGQTGGGGGGGGAAGGGGGSSAIGPTVTGASTAPGINLDADGSVTLDYSAQAQVACVVVSVARFTG